MKNKYKDSILMVLSAESGLSGNDAKNILPDLEDKLEKNISILMIQGDANKYVALFPISSSRRWWEFWK